MVRSALAIFVGVATLTAISFGIEAVADPLLMRFFPASLPTRAALSHSLAASLFGFVYGALSIAGGGYVTARIARRAPILHAALLGGVQTLLTVAAMAAMWSHAPAVNWMVTLIITLPSSLAGGWLFARLSPRRAMQSSASLSRLADR